MRRPEETAEESDETVEDRLLGLAAPAESAAGYPATSGRSSAAESARSRQRKLGWFAAGSTGLIVGSWVLWLMLGGTQIEATVISFDPISDTEIRVTGQVTHNGNQPANCIVEALGTQKQIVGWVEVHIPETTGQAQPVSVLVRTVEPAITGLISRCHVP